MNEVILTKENFESEVISSEIPVFVDFWAEWCGPCRMVAPVFEELSEMYSGRVKFCKLNIDDESGIASEKEVASIPTLILFKDGVEANRIIGARPIDDFIEFLDGNL